MRPQKNISLSSKLFIVVLSLFLSFSLCFLFFQYQREKIYRFNILNTRLQDCNNDIRDLLVSSSQSLPALENRLKKEGIRVTVLDMQGRVLSDSQAADSSTFENHIDRKEIRDALTEGTGYDIKRASKTMGGDWFYSATAFPEDNLIVRTAHLYDVSMTRMLASDRGFLWAALGFALILIFIYYLYVRKIKRNIAYLRTFADMAEKNEDIENADIEFSDDELGEISRNIVHLYAKLQNSEDDKTRLKRQLTQNVAHELKTPVSSIRGYLETIKYNPDMDESMRNEFVSRCYAQSTRLGNLISDITLLSKIDEASGTFTTEDIDVEQLVSEIKKEVEPQLEAKRMRFLVLIPPDIVVNGNQLLLYSIFRNLTDNAIAYAGEGATVTVQYLDEEQGHYVFSFADNGAGVPPEHLPHLFERFYRVDKGRSRKLGGTGLGLAIVKNAVILHGGKISVKIAKSGGLEFTFSLTKAGTTVA